MTLDSKYLFIYFKLSFIFGLIKEYIEINIINLKHVRFDLACEIIFNIICG
jgi:hypothetical protein